VQIIVRDVTQEEEVRQNLERTASEMARLNQMKNSFLGLASHELKTPLTIIMGYVELLLSEREPPLDEDTIKLVRHIAKASDRLSEIVRDIVDVSMIDSRTVDLVSRYVDVNVLVMRAAGNLDQFIKQRDQVLSLNLADELPLIKCDFERIVQVIGNILNNAIKFTPDKGRIIVETKLVLRPREPEKFASLGADGSCTLSNEQVPYVEIAVHDSGIGIAEAEQEAIFEKFYEVGDVEEHSTGKVAFKSRGAGLGLSIVKGIVDLHGGAVWVDSPGYDPDAMPGSTFYLLLPASSADA
jgi:signal transduction histidine kinase